MLWLNGKVWTRAFGARIISSNEDAGDEINLFHMCRAACPIHIPICDCSVTKFVNQAEVTYWLPKTNLHGKQD
jgi:hypothetical protein